MKPTRVFICDSQPVLIEGLAAVLAASPEMELAGAAAGVEEALASLPEPAPDLILISEELESPVNARALGALRGAAPEARLVLWSQATDCQEACRDTGFTCALSKRIPVSELRAGLRAVAQGACWMEGRRAEHPPLKRRDAPRLTRRERDIVRLVAEGRKNREVAEALAISPGTVKVHLMHIFEKAGVEDRLQLALLARRLLSQDPDQPSRLEPAPEAAPV